MKNRQHTIAKCRSVIVPTAAALLLLTTVFAVGVRSQERESNSRTKLGLGFYEVIDEPLTDSAPPESKLNLEIRLNTPNPIACIGSTVWLEVEITNTGKNPVMIGKHEVWASFTYHRFRTDSEEDRDDTTYLGGLSVDYFTLEVGQFYRDTFEFSLRGHGFFGNVGKYALRSKIESVKSNEVVFELYDCGNTKEEAN